MAPEQPIRRYGKWYARLLRLYPKPFRERYAEGMAQTFTDLLRERRDAKGRLLPFACWMFVETSAGIARENARFMAMQYRKVIRVAAVTACLLLVPLVAMQFTGEVSWTLFDFVVAGGLLFGTGLAYELLAGRSGRTAYRIAAGVALATALFLVWANLAVGIIGSENEPANLMYFGVLAVGIVGAIVARFQARGMARALLATAAAQALAAMIALIAGMDAYPGSSVAEIVLVNGFFVSLFALSASLFRRAGVTNAT